MLDATQCATESMMEIRKKQTVVITTFSEGQGSPFLYPVQRGGAGRGDTLVTTPSKQNTKRAPKPLKVHYKTEDMTKKPSGSSS